MEIVSERPYFTPDEPVRNLPNATAVLVLGILSILGCCYYGSGLILAIIAIVLGNRDEKLFRMNPAGYTLSSYNNMRAGKVCAIIGIIICSLCALFYIVLVATLGFDAINHPDQFQDALRNI